MFTAIRSPGARILSLDSEDVVTLPTRRLDTSIHERGLRGTAAAKALIVPPKVALAVLAPKPPAGEAEDNLLLASVKDDPINIEWGGRGDAFPGDTLVFMLDNVTFATMTVTGSEVPPFIGVLPSTSREVEGKHILNVIYGGPTGDAKSDDVPITFDYTAPGLNVLLAPLLFDDADDIPETGITAAKFRTGADGKRFIWAEVASYGGMASGDIVHLYCNGKEAAGVGIALVVNKHIEVHITEDFLISQIGDTPTAKFTYKIEDRAGLISDESKPVTVAVQISQIPNLVAPTVPAYDNDAVDPLIDEADARGVANAGFIVVVPWNVGLEATDTILLSLGTQNAGPVPIGPDGDDMQILFPYAGSQAVWVAGSTNGTLDQRVPADVTYTVIRGAASAGTSPAHPVELNLYQKAIDPDPETPANERLEAPVVVSASGKRDEIPAEDFGKDGFVEIVKRTDVNFPPRDDSLEEGDTLNIYYDSQPSFAYTVPPLGDMTEPLKIPLDKAVIEAGGSGDAVPVWYEVVHALTDGGTNINLSPTKTIVVSGTDTQPGGGHLAAGDFPDKLASGFIPENPYHYTATRFTIPTYSNRDPDDKIDLHFELYYGDTHLAGEVPYAGRDWDHSITSGTSDPITVDVPSTVYNLFGNTEGLIPRIHIHAVYTVTKVKGNTTPVTSDQANVKVDSRFSDGPDAGT